MYVFMPLKLLKYVLNIQNIPFKNAFMLNKK